MGLIIKLNGYNIRFAYFCQYSLYDKNQEWFCFFDEMEDR